MLGGELDIGDVGAGFRFGQGERSDHGTGARSPEPVALLLIAEQADRAGTKALHGESEIAERVVPRQTSRE